MYKFYKVIVRWEMHREDISIKLRKVEYATAKNEDAVADDFFNRYRNSILSLGVEEIKESEVPKNRRVYIVM